MKMKILKDLYCFQCSLQFDKKSIYDMHLKLVHDHKNIAGSIFGTEIKQEPAEIELPLKLTNNEDQNENKTEDPSVPDA